MIKRSKFLVIMCLMALSGMAQDGNSQDTTKEVSKKYKHQIVEDAKKLYPPLSKQRIRVSPPDFEYSIKPTLYHVNTYYREPMQPISLGRVQLPELTRFYGLGAFGNYRNALLDLYYNSKRHETWSYSARGYHRSGNGPLDNSSFGKSLVELQGKKSFKKHTLQGDVNFKQIRSHLYGYDHDSLTFEDSDSLRRDFFHYGGLFSFGNERSKETTHHYNTQIGGYYMNDNEGMFEWNVLFKANIKEHLSNGDHLLFKAHYDYSSYGDSAIKLNRNMVFTDVAYLHEKGKLRVQGGIKAAVDNGDSVITERPEAADYTSFHLYPDIHARYKLVKNYLIAYAGLTGNLQKNSYYQIVQTNPFVGRRQNLTSSNNTLKIYGGVKGSITNDVLFNVKLDYSNFEAFQLFANDDDIGNEMFAVYSGANSSIFNVHGELQYKQNKRWMANFSMDYNYYNFYTYPELHLPTIQANVSGRYNFQDKIIFRGEINAFNTRQGMNISKTDTTELSGAFDLSLGGDYYFNERVAAYVALNNILNQKYQLWNRYPVQGINAWIGIRFSL